MDTKLTKKAFIETYEKSFGNVTRSCRAVNISRQTYYNWKKNDKDFKNTLDCIEPENIFIDFAESKLVDKINTGCTASIIFALKTKGKKRGYVERQEITGAEGLPTNVTVEIIRNENKD